MMMETIQEKMDRMKAKAEVLVSEKKRIFLKDVYDSIYFADILFVGEKIIEVQCFGPPQKAGKKEIIYWVDILELQEYKTDLREKGKRANKL